MHRALIHVSLVVRDYDEAIDFYTKVLDFDLIEDRYQPQQDKRWVVVAPKGSSEATILLARASGPEQEACVGRQTGGRVFLFLHTDDFWRDYTLLTSRGVRFTRAPTDAEYGTVAVFEDLYGNLWDLVQLRAGHPVSRRLARGAAQRRTGGDSMNEQSLFTGFWTDESKTTRNVLARIPEGSDYRPDPKSRTAREIAWQIVCEEKMIIDALETGRAEWSPPPLPATMKEVLDAYEKQSAGLPDRFGSLPPERWSGTLEFFGQQRPAAPMAWSFLFDIVHHRGQITTYLRPMGSTVPQIYGPSADEP